MLLKNSLCRQNKVTDAEGEMTFENLEPGDYYLKALLKEFQFQPSAMNIELKEEETKEVGFFGRCCKRIGFKIVICF